MGIVDFLTWIRRESGYGGAPVITGPAAANDLPTVDLLRSFNARRNRIWAKTDWEWQREFISFPIVVGTDTYAVAAKSGNLIDRIYNIIPYDTTASPPVYGKPLRQRTEREFYSEIAGYGAPYPGMPDRYLNLGRINNAWNIKIWPAPQSAFTMGGSAKGLLNTFLIGDVTGVAPFSPANTAMAINPAIDYFPAGIVDDVLFWGCMSDAAFCQKNYADAKTFDAAFEDKLKLRAAEQAEAAKDNSPITSPLPAIVRQRRGRGR